jgi:hypothetical protein
VVPQILLERRGIVAGVVDRPPENVRPDAGDIGASERVGTNDVDPLEGKRLTCLFTANEFDGGDLAEIVTAYGPMSRLFMIAASEDSARHQSPLGL